MDWRSPGILYLPAIQGGGAHPVPGGAGPVHYTERHRVHRDQPDVQCI